VEVGRGTGSFPLVLERADSHESGYFSVYGVNETWEVTQTYNTTYAYSGKPMKSHM
jgi:hypothetical protein